MTSGSWPDEMLGVNESFRNEATLSLLPRERPPGKRGVITCMDPRVNLAAVGIEPFARDGAHEIDRSRRANPWGTGGRAVADGRHPSGRHR